MGVEQNGSQVERRTALIEANVGRAKIQPQVLPLALRGASNYEIANITSLTSEQVKKATYELRTSGKLRRQEPEKIHKQISKGQLRVWRMFGEQRRERMRKRNVGRAKIQPQVLPLALRRGTWKDIASRTGFTPKQVKDAIHRLRTGGELRSTKEGLPGIERGAHHGAGTRNRDDIPNQQNNLAFARKIIEAGLITTDLSHWNDLNNLYNKNKRQLPVEFNDQLRLEVFLASRWQAEAGNKTLLQNYIQLGEGIDKAWFDSTLNEEQRFIRDAVSNQRKMMISGENRRDSSSVSDLAERIERGKEFLSESGTF